MAHYIKALQTQILYICKSHTEGWLGVHSEHLLIWQLFFIIRNNISHEKREEQSTFLYSLPEGLSIYRVLSENICLQHRIWGFVNGTTVRKLLALRISLASATAKMLLQRGKKMEVIWCQDSTEPDTLQPCLRNLDGSISNICSTALTLHQWLAFFFFLSFFLSFFFFFFF